MRILVLFGKDFYLNICIEQFTCWKTCALVKIDLVVKGSWVLCGRKL